MSPFLPPRARMARTAPALALLLAAGVRPAAAQPPGPPPDAPIATAERAAVVDSTVARLRRGYVHPDAVAAVGAVLRERRQRGAYDTCTTARTFAAALTADLQAAARDRHLEVEYAPAAPDAPSSTTPQGAGPSTAQQDAARDAEREAERAFKRAVNHGVDRVERLPGNVGVLALRVFERPSDAGEKVAAAMALLADTDALIVDLRYNPGGHPAAVQFLASYLFDGPPVLLNTLVWRTAAGNAPTSVTDTARGPALAEQAWTLPFVPGRHYVGQPVYVLTSHHTASGAEGFAYALQTRGRGIVVGDTTRGAANAGGTERLTPRFTLFVPRGRAVNPVTGTSWERVGVAPDLVVPEERAFATAYARALRAIARRGGYAGPESLDALARDAEAAAAPPARPASK